MNKFLSVADDIEWLRKEWLLADPESISEGDIRRGSSTLRLLLTDGLLQKAWRHVGHEKQPTLTGPDIGGLASREGLRLDLAALVVAGGARMNHIEWAYRGIFRADNQETGVRAEAEEGFGVQVTAIMRDTRKPIPEPWLPPLLYRKWPLSEYLESPGAVRKGVVIKRREVIEYFRNYTGGVHHDLLNASKKNATKRELYELAAEVGRHSEGELWDGLHFELLSIGQAVAGSADVIELANQIRADTQK
jgi:hypothetical protein